MKLEFTDKAAVDFAEIWVHNAERYNVEHADKYRDFLLAEMDQLTEHPELGRVPDKFPALRYLVMKRRASGHGHVAYYEVFDDTIRIVRILHTAMYAPDHLGNS